MSYHRLASSAKRTIRKESLLSSTKTGQQIKRNKLIEENERLRKANLRLTEEVHVIIELTKVSALKLQTTQRSNAHKKSMVHSMAALRSSEQTLRQTIVHLKEQNEHLQWELKEKAKKSLE